MNQIIFYLNSDGVYLGGFWERGCFGDSVLKIVSNFRAIIYSPGRVQIYFKAIQNPIENPFEKLFKIHFKTIQISLEIFLGKLVN